MRRRLVSKTATLQFSNTPSGRGCSATRIHVRGAAAPALGFGRWASATLSFTGTGVSWIGFRGPQTGIARVHLDGTLVATVDAYSPTEVTQAVLYTVSGLPNASHQSLIEVTRTKNDASSDFYVIVDAFDITGPGGGPADTTPPSVNFTSPTGRRHALRDGHLAATASDDVGVAVCSSSSMATPSAPRTPRHRTRFLEHGDGR